MRILGIDPGLATGFAVYDTESLSIVDTEESADGIYGFQTPFEDIWNEVRSDLPIDFMACENFTLRPDNDFTANLKGVEIIGWLKGQGFWGKYNPEPSQHMQLTRLRKKKDSYAKSPVTHMMKRDGHKIGKGHTRMAASVAIWYAAKVLNHEPTLELLKPKDAN